MSSSSFVKSLIGENKNKKLEETKYLNKNEDWKQAVARVMLTGILRNQYYRSADNAAKEAIKLFVEVSKKDPTYLLKAAAYARNVNMKGMVKLGIAALAANASDDFLDTYRSNIVDLLATFNPNQLLQFVELMKSKALGRGFGARSQKWIQLVMQSWNDDRIEEFTLKYPTSFKALLRLAHPNYKGFNGKLVRYLLDPNKKTTAKDYGKAFGKKQKAVEKMKTLKSESKVAELMLENSVPWDVVKGFHQIKGDVGLAMMTQMGLSALLLNIKSLEQNNILNTKQAMKALEMKLNEVKNGRSIPIDFAKPYIHCSNVHIKQLLVKAIVDSLENSMPEIEGRNIGVSVDISGSMAGEPLVTAGLLAVPFLKSKKLWFTTFDTSLYEEGENPARNYSFYSGFCPKLKGKNKTDQVNSLLQLKTAGGTDVAISLRKAITNKIKLDLHVLITDEQQNTGTPLMKEWKEYKKKVNPRAELWVINASNLEWHAADFEDPSVTVYQTMTPAIFKNLQFFGQDLPSAIEEFDLSKVRKVSVMPESDNE
jgi:hypothetical protein